MKRSVDDNLCSRVYSYGSVPQRVAPVLGEDYANGQLGLAHRLWNVLVAIDRARIERYRKIMCDDAQQKIESLKKQMADLRDAIKAARQKVRKRSVDVTPEKEALAAMRAEMGALIEHQRQTAPDRHAARKTELDALHAATNRRIIRARQAAASMGLFWGTYNDIIQRADSARKLGDMQFRRRTADGTLTAQIIGGATVARCVSTGTHTFFQIDARVDGEKWQRARMRVGSDQNRQPVWLDIPIVYHRDIPSAALIKSVSMTRRSGRWQLNVTVNIPKPELSAGPRAVAVDIGWRLLPEGVRVGYWQDAAGAHSQVLVPMADVDALVKVRELRSKCDLLRDEFLPALCAWLDGEEELSDEWKQRTRALAQWRSSDRLAEFGRWWGDHRLPGDEEIFEAACVWRKQYLHLARFWRGLENRVRLRIREQYRIFASEIAGKYDTLYIEKFDLRKVVRRPAPESTDVMTASSTYRQMVSPSVFRAALVNASTREGVNVVKLEAAYTTCGCHVCGHVDEWDQAADVMHRCGGCNALWDQDQNAAINLLAAGAGHIGSDPKHGSQSGLHVDVPAGNMVGTVDVPARRLGI
jgi:hypothetical protein